MFLNVLNLVANSDKIVVLKPSLIDIIYRKEDTVFDALADEIDVDTLVNEAVGVQEQAPKKRKTAQKEKGVWRCENKFCKDYGKEFKYISQKVRHDG